MKVQDSYKTTTLRILGNCQLLEFGLKIHIAKTYELIQFALGERMHFDYSISDVENLPLGQLLGIFKKLNPNKDLQKRLQALQKQRNFVAHQALLFVIGSQTDADTVCEKHLELYRFEDELSECITALIEESNAMLSRFAQRPLDLSELKKQVDLPLAQWLMNMKLNSH